MKLSIIIPVFNEGKTIRAVLKNVLRVNFGDVKTEIIVVNDGSSDNTESEINKQKAESNRLIVINHERNSGKGAAVRTGIKHATGDYIIIQDADHEYNPEDIPVLLKALKNNKSVVYGTRLKRMPHLSNEERTTRFLMHYVGNRFLSLITSVLYGQWLTDMETCYKLFPRSEVKNMTLKSKRFDFEPEITAKILKRGLKITEIPIQVKPRGYDEGKKLNTFRDGTVALMTLIKYRITD